MAVSEHTVEALQGYSIVRIRETESDGTPLVETYALHHEAGVQIDEFATHSDAVRALNRMLFPLPGLAVPDMEQAV